MTEQTTNWREMACYFCGEKIGDERKLMHHGEVFHARCLLETVPVVGGANQAPEVEKTLYRIEIVDEGLARLVGAELATYRLAPSTDYNALVVAASRLANQDVNFYAARSNHRTERIDEIRGDVLTNAPWIWQIFKRPTWDAEWRLVTTYRVVADAA